MNELQTIPCSNGWEEKTKKKRWLAHLKAPPAGQHLALADFQLLHLDTGMDIAVLRLVCHVQTMSWFLSRHVFVIIVGGDDDPVTFGTVGRWGQTLHGCFPKDFPQQIVHRRTRGSEIIERWWLG